MQLDFTQLKSKFEKVTSFRPMPHREYVELYIKAYYLPENSFEEWIKEHKVLRSTIIVPTLMQCSCNISFTVNI